MGRELIMGKGKENRMTINTKNVIISGLVAGVIINLSAITMVPVVGNEMDAVIANLGLPPLSNAAMGYFSFISFVFGMLLMYLYALAKPLFVSKIKTAVIVSTIVWILAYLSSNLALAVYGFMPLKFVIIGSVWGLLELLLASIIGSRFYK